MALEILKFGEKEIHLNISESALEKLIDAGLCTRSKISDDFILQELKNGTLLIPYESGIKLQKIKTLKTKGECINVDNMSIPLTTIRNICEYIRTNESVGDVKRKMVGQKNIVTFIKDFMDIKAGKKMQPEYDKIKSRYGDIFVSELIRNGFATKEKEDIYEAAFSVSSPYSYYNSNNDYRVRIHNGTVGIGCKSFKTSYMKRLGKILDKYLGVKDK